MIDDVLDYKGQAGRLGKPAGQDLAEGRITLPFILARERLAGTLKDRLMELGAKSQLTEAEKEEIINLVTGSGALEEAQSQAEKLAQAALADLNGFSPELKEPLVRLSRAMVIRDY
jgi:octaprenyl-diphosphate synthase